MQALATSNEKRCLELERQQEGTYGKVWKEKRGGKNDISIL